MSIVAMMQDAATKREKAPVPEKDAPRAGRGRQKARATSQDKPASIAAAAATELARYIPIEAITLYTGVLPLLVAENQPLTKQDFTGRWILAAAVGLFALLFAVGVYKRELEARGGKFKWPPKRTLTVTGAYAAWVFIVPGSPFQGFTWYSPTLGAIVGAAAVAVLTLFTLWFGAPEE